MKHILLTLNALLLAQPLQLKGAEPFFETFTAIPSDGKEFKQNSYPTVAALPDGRLFLAWAANDGQPAHSRIAGAFSSDGGRRWSTPETIIDTPLMDGDPTIILAPDEIQVCSTTRPADKIVYTEMWKSSRKFNGSRWSEPVKMPAHHKYEVGRIHIGMTLPDGTLLMPYSWDVLLEQGGAVKFEGNMKLKSGALRSRDNGKTWTPGGDMFVEVTNKVSARGTGGVCEPAMVLLPDGGIFALLRTSDSWHYQSRSRDGGLTWDTPSPSPLAGHNSPSALWRLRDSGDVLVVWNNSPRNRWPLDVALSKDGCKTWSKPRTLASVPGFQSAYPTATQTADGTLIAIWFQILPDNARELRIARFNREWLLDAAQSEDGVFRTTISPVTEAQHGQWNVALTELPAGRALAIWEAGHTEVKTPNVIMSSLSWNGGRTWGERREFYRRPGMRCTPCGFYRVKNLLHCVLAELPMAGGKEPCRVLLRTSADGGGSWSEAREIWRTEFGVAMQPVVLRDGRIALPVYHRGAAADGTTTSISRVLVSKDEGATWQEGGAIPAELPGGAMEPALAEIAAGECLCVVRTRGTGRLYASRSKDGGRTWDAPAPLPLESPESIAKLLRLADGSLLVVWNGVASRTQGPRNRLTAARSFDGGRTWPQRRDLVCGGLALSNHGVLQLRDGRVLVGYQHLHADPVRAKQRGGVDSVDLAIFDLDWLAAPGR